MKTKPSRFLAAVALLAGVIFVHAVGTANAQSIDPATGQPASGAASASHIDPITGLPVSNKDGKPIGGGATFDSINRETFASAASLSDRVFGRPLNEVRGLVANGQYDEALQRFRLFHTQRKDTKSFSLTLFVWFELGRKFPKATEALVEIRDQDVSELSGGRGNSDLFWEVKLINDYLNEGDATYALFKTIYQQDKKLAGQCYPYSEDLLVQKGEYGLCLSYIGDPQKCFESFRSDVELMRKVLPLWRESQRRIQQNGEESLKKARQFQQENQKQAQQYGQELQSQAEQYRQELWEKYPGSLPPPSNDAYTPGPMPAPYRLTPSSFTPLDVGQMTTNHFVGRIRELVEILAGAGRLSDAEKIRDEAVATLDDPRLQSAVSDAEKKIKK